MHPDLRTRRHVLTLMYRRYLEVDLEWSMTLREAQTWFPPQAPLPRTSIGETGSRVRRAYERRDRALQQLHVAKLQLEVARQRAMTLRQSE